MHVGFVIGVARSGTTLLARMLGAHPDVVSGPETHLFNNGVSTLFDNFDAARKQDTDPIGLSQYLGRDELTSLIRSFCDDTLDAYRKKTKPDATVVVEKTPFVESGAAKEISRKLECYPDAHYLHIVRDPRAVVRSLENAWFATYSLRRAAELWAESVSAVCDVAPSVGQFMELRYERLVAEPEAVITDVLAWLGLSTSRDALTRVLNATKYRYASKEAPVANSDGRWQNELTPAQVAQIEAIAGPAMTTLGYEHAAGDARRGAERRAAVSTDRIVQATRRVARGARHVVHRPRELWSSTSARLGRALQRVDEQALADVLDERFSFHRVPEPPGPSPRGHDAVVALLEAAQETFAAGFEAEQWSTVDGRTTSTLWFAGTRADGQRVYVSLLVAWDNGRATRIAWLERGDAPAATIDLRQRETGHHEDMSGRRRA